MPTPWGRLGTWTRCRKVARCVEVAVCRKLVRTWPAKTHLQVTAILTAEAVRRAKCEAFAMGQLDRLGAKSRVLALDAGVVRMVLEHV
mmetsp:Transcript_2321/g.5497  ORF Transcript_2321/g.5497 Transcript_2321/m.5497 type:complete len:88 (-) Transcript_2321:54-317(-)